MAELPQVDKRDGLPYAIADMDYLVVASPAQTHLNPGEQRVVTIPAEAMLSDSPLSAAFERMDCEFRLQNGVSVFVFRRIRPNTQAELDWLWTEIGLTE